MVTAIVAGAAYEVYRNRKRIVEFFQARYGRRANQRQPLVEVDSALAEVCPAFLMYADNFQGLYETMYKASQGRISRERMNNVLLEWDIRMDNIPNAPVALKSWWATVIDNATVLSDSEAQERAKRVVQMVYSCGIIRDAKTTIVAAADTSMFYLSSTDENWHEGQRLRIESPCWYMQTKPIRVIEKGFCEII